MGELRLKAKVRSGARRLTRECDVFFDSGSTKNLIRAEFAAELGSVIPLAAPVRFRGIADGAFKSRQLVQLHLRLGGVWVDTLAYVAPPEAFEERILLGQEFMQEFGVVLDMRRDRVLLDVRRLKRGHYIH